MNQHTLELLILIAIAAAAITLIRKHGTAATPYEKRRSLLTATELNFKRFLEQAIPENTVIMAQVALEEIIVVHEGSRGKERAAARARIKSRRIDFVICDRNTMNIECAIELNDRSHQRSERKARDTFIRSALAAGGVPFLEIPAARTYDTRALRAQLQQAIQAPHDSAERSPPPRASTAR